MPQDNTARKDTSMDDILSSIRRIIDESEARKGHAPEGPSAPANDVASAPRAAAAADQERDDPNSLRNVLAKLDADIGMEPEGDLIDDDDTPASAQAKQYDARFSEADSKAFATVADVLAGQAGGGLSAKSDADVQDKADIALDDVASDGAVATQSTPLSASSLHALISEPVAQSVAQSFGSLEVAFKKHSDQSLVEVTQEMLKPMLQDWLDENLPSMVERMVRSEIERIARGEPRQG